MLASASHRLVVVLALSLCASCATVGSAREHAASAQTSAVFLRDVSVVDVVAGVLVPAQDVLLCDGRIASVAPTGGAPPSDAQIVPCDGAFLMPGLWDFHAHALSAKRWERTRRLLLAHGVTGFRDPNTTRPFDEIAALREDIADGSLLAPRFVTSGPMVDGPNPVFADFWSVATLDEGRAAVVRLHEGGMDFVKVYTRLPRDVFFAMLDEAQQRGLPVGGHVPLELTAAEASDAGMTFIEHSYRHRMDACSAEARIRALLREVIDAEIADDFPTMLRIEKETFLLGIETYDSQITEDLGRRFARNGTWFTPTLVEGLARYRPEIQDEDDSLRALFADARLAWVPQAEWRGWLQELAQDRGWFWGRVDLAGVVDAVLRDEWRRERENRLRMVLDLHRGGAGILAGTDAADNFAFVFFGASLHEELELLVQAGLTTTEALQSATLLPARALGLEDELGSVVPGKAADLVLLDGDPLADIHNTTRIRAVMRGGRLLDRATLDGMLAEAAEFAAAQDSEVGRGQ